jgi:RNA polymerase sigma-70 factor (ECF subfamily)
MKKIDFRTDVLPLKNELYRLALRITLNPAEAEDVVQETMIRVWNRREQWDEIESIEAFCLTICRNMALDRQKSAANQTDTLDNGHDAPDHSYASNPEEQTVQKDRVALVRRLMDQLPEKQRACMQLRDIEGKSYKEIAEVLVKLLIRKVSVILFQNFDGNVLTMYQITEFGQPCTILDRRFELLLGGMAQV